MLYRSTRDPSKKVSLSDAIKAGLSSEGGLFVPEKIPQIDPKDFNTEVSYANFCQQVLTPFFKGDALEAKLADLCEKSFTFPVTLHTLSEQTVLMELFQGPTLSFKDFGARFLASCLDEVDKKEKITVMVATSGDTGSAVASAFHKKNKINVVIFFPENKVSKRQQHQITCWGDNVYVFSLKGIFDQCQKLLKDSFQDQWWLSRTHLCTANSINIGRLLPQIAYYAYTSLVLYNERNQKPGVLVPSGNMGNVTAAYFAKAMGFPIREIAIASNKNQVISDYLETGSYDPKPSVATLANAMDVGRPSNFDRLQYLFPSFDVFKENVQAFSVNDEQIKETIRKTHETYSYILCPHTATGVFARQALGEKLWVIAATAHPSKFETIIEPIIGQKLLIPPGLQALLSRKCHFQTVEPTMEAVKAAAETEIAW